MIGQNHLIECHCVLPIYKDRLPILYHKFPVYSKVSKNGKILHQYVNCNNCGATHYVYEICKSDVKAGKEDIPSIISKEDLMISLPDKINKVLEKNNCEINVYAMIDDIIDQEVFPYDVILSREIIDEEHTVKLLEMRSKDKFKIKVEKLTTIVR